MFANDLLKRKRSIDGGSGELPPAKRSSSQTLVLDDKAAEQLRKQVQRIYISYDSIIGTRDGEPDEAAFQALLDAAQGEPSRPNYAPHHPRHNSSALTLPSVPLFSGDCPSRRLAARLIPRLITKFPRKADTAAALLTSLHEFKQPCAFSTPAFVDAIKRDALAGLASVLAAVRRHADGDTRGAERIVEYLLR